MQSPASLPYDEPSAATLLVQSSLLLLLNIVNALLDRAIYCGLVGQILLGVAWGTPGAKWLDSRVEAAMVQLGYIGLVLLVYHGGLSTSIPSLKANLFLSLGVAITGISAPISLSFILRYILDATPLQCFAAGAALCSTSLGTTFTVLATSGLVNSRLGVVLTSAAMMDDVVGLVLVQVIANLGTSISAVTIVRPLGVSLAFAVCAPLMCVCAVAPATTWLNNRRGAKPDGWLNKGLAMPETALTIHTLILLGCVAAASYAGTSNLFAAYIAGAAISWWDSEVSHSILTPSTRSVASQQETEGTSTAPEQCEASTAGLGIYDKYYAAAVDRVLRPFFFASIGFSIPITKMFTGDIVWKGAVYAVLMILCKLVCGAWLLRFSFRLGAPKRLHQSIKTKRAMRRLWCISDKTKQRPESNTPTSSQEPSANAVSDNGPPAGTKPRSLYPAAIIGCAMTARGEIGFLISSIAESKGIFGDAEASTNSKMFLVVTWAIVLCTILGPLAVGFLVKRVKKLQGSVERSGGCVQDNVLGVWGVH